MLALLALVALLLEGVQGRCGARLGDAGRKDAELQHHLQRHDIMDLEARAWGQSLLSVPNEGVTTTSSIEATISCIYY